MPFSHFLETCRHRVNQTLLEQVDTYTVDKRLQEAMRYSLFNGGKRIRPILVYGSANTIGDISPTADLAAAAVEAIHAYSLIHDDLPAMDDDSLRRGKPACHIEFDEATAILAGDALQTLAFEMLSQPRGLPGDILQQMILTLTKGSGARGMVAGQSMDLTATNQQLNLQQLETMHGLKTGALINASIRLGALSTQVATANQLNALEHYSHAIGLAFQVQDDIIDVTSDTATLGKQQGADANLNKPTYVSLLGLDAAKQKAKSLHQQALDALSSFDNRADYLRHLSEYIINRNH
ncbi:geranyl transferase [Candidatus Endobugula sertula]|uniref:Geranyl transferase n=1 Tax=Candidatus Endobugula sertula TaxID=62101 RepID=A0A1D2QML4_9GAMM|nr:geranyl transferase [Candidatus Endobugula sertula]